MQRFLDRERMLCVVCKATGVVALDVVAMEKVLAKWKKKGVFHTHLEYLWKPH